MVNRHPIITAVDKLTAPLRRRVALMVGRAVLMAVDDGTKCQTVQITALKGEVLDGVERVTEYGFTSHPHPGADAVVVAVGGNRDHGVVIALGDRRYRLTGLAAGEVALHDEQSQVIKLARSGIEITTAQAAGVTVTAPLVTVTAPNVVVNADSIDLAGMGGVEIARVGDLVNVGTGSSAGQWPIVSGSPKVRAN